MLHFRRSQCLIVISRNQALGADESFLWNFGSSTDGFYPYGGLVRDLKGNLYGTTPYGGSLGGGAVFELSPPSSKDEPWSESILWNFGAIAHDGLFPESTLTLDRSGRLYGTTYYGGTGEGELRLC